MKKYQILLLGVVILIFLYAELAFLALVTFIITILLIIQKPSKKFSKNIWNEIDKAKPKDVTPIIKEYVENASKKSAEFVTRKENTQYQLTSIHQFQKGTTNFFNELKRLFK
jgi:hypothetical protein